MRPTDGLSTYCATRGAQNVYVKAAGKESAQNNVQINAVGRNWVLGGYPSDYMDSDKNRARVEKIYLPGGSLKRGSKLNSCSI
jgi:hypothetical protein